MKRSIIVAVIVLPVFFAGCAFFSSPKESVSQPEKEARTLIRKAAELTRRNNYTMARYFYQDALNRFSSINNLQGKARAILGLLKADVLSGHHDRADSLLTQLAETTKYKDVLYGYYLEGKAFIAEQSGDGSTLAAVFDEGGKRSVPVETRSILATYILFSPSMIGKPAADSARVFLGSNLENLLLQSQNGTLDNDETPAIAAYALGLEYFRQSRFDKAEQYTASAQSTDQLINNAKGIADDSYLLGKVFFKTADFNKSALQMNTAADIYSLIHDTTMADLSNASALIAEYKISRSAGLLKQLIELGARSESNEVRALIRKYIP